MQVPAPQDLWSDLRALHAAALRAAEPAASIRRVLSVEGDRIRAGDRAVSLGAGGRLWLVAFGKASLAMTRAADELLGDRVTSGVISAPSAPGPDWPARYRIFRAGHPLPDLESLAAGNAALDLLRGARTGDVLLALISGGGSALFESLHPGVTLGEAREITCQLQRDGADVLELNTVRRALSRVKGGGLARAARPAGVLALILSDVIGDAPAAIASGPTVPSPTGPSDALAILERRGLAVRFPRITEFLLASARAEAKEESGADATDASTLVIGSNRTALDAVRAEAEARGFPTWVASESLHGEARDAGRLVANLVRSVREDHAPLAPPACLVFGGETTVTVRGTGRGGRNQELALAAALCLDGIPRVAILSFATDGIDGPTDAAGAVVTGETVPRARAAGISAREALENNDAWTFFRALGDLWVTGATGTNVNDVAVALIYP